MISTNNPEPECNFWEELQTKVAEIENRNKERIKHATLPANQKSARKKKLGRFELEEAWHRHAQENNTIINRLNYLEQEKQRRERTLQLTRRKFQRVMEIRSRSMKEKEETRQMRTLVLQDAAREASSRALRIREERALTSQSVRRVKADHQREASALRQRIEEEEKAVATERLMDKQFKRQIVEEAHERGEEEKLRRSKMQEDRIEQGRINHRVYLRHQLERNKYQQRKNSVLRQKLQASLSHADERKDLTSSQLNEMQSEMLPTPRAKKMRLFSSD